MSFPQSEQSSAYSAIVNCLKNDPVLKREVKTLVSWTGEKLVPPSSENCPYLRLKPKSAPGQDWRSPCAHRQDFLIDVLTVVNGADVRIAMDFWSCLERTFFPKDQDLLKNTWDRLKNLGIVQIHFLKGSVEVKESSTGQTVQGEGLLRVEMSIGLKNPGV